MAMSVVSPLSAPTAQLKPFTNRLRRSAVQKSAQLSRRQFSTLVRAAIEDNDSYQKLEDPVRADVGTVGPKVAERQSLADDALKSDAANPDRQILNTDVGFLEMMRFKGALPELLNCRLAMLGFVWGAIAERLTGKDLFNQVGSQPTLIALVVLAITVASAVPFYRGVRRSGNPVFTPDAELWIGRTAMLGMLGAVISTASRGSIF